jgi:hypothetical protein
MPRAHAADESRNQLLGIDRCVRVQDSTPSRLFPPSEPRALKVGQLLAATEQAERRQRAQGMVAG